jgi:hypothetical protein
MGEDDRPSPTTTRHVLPLWRPPFVGAHDDNDGTPRGRRRDRGARRLEEEDGGGGGGGGRGDGDDLPRRTAQQLAWRERTTQQSTKAMETTKVVKTRTVNARVKARSGVCEWVDCCCCCFRSSWDRRTRRFKWPLSPSHRRRRAAAVVPHEVPVQPDRSRPERWCQRPYDLLSPHPRAIALALTKYFKLKHPAANTAGSSSMLTYIYAFRRRGSVLPIP